MASIGFIIVTARSKKSNKFSPAILEIDTIEDTQDMVISGGEQTKDSRVKAAIFKKPEPDNGPSDCPPELAMLKKLAGGVKSTIAVFETVEQVYQKLANAALGIVDQYVMPEVGENTYKEPVG